MQRGCVSTLAASAKMARERSAGSEMAANAGGGCNVLESCAEAETDTAPAMQHSNATRSRSHAALCLRPKDNFSERQKFTWRNGAPQCDKSDRLALHWRAPRNRFVFVLD